MRFAACRGVFPWLDRTFLKKPLVNVVGAVRFSRERGSRENTYSWQRMRLGFENGIESSAVFAAGFACVGSFVAGGFFLCRGAGGCKKEFQAGRGQCGTHSQASCSSGSGGHRVFSGRREGVEDSGDKGRVYAERSLQSDAQRLAIYCGETSKIRSVSHQKARTARC